MNNQILLSILSGLGVSGSAYSWIASYLASHSYQVTWRGSVSAPHSLTTGVPQGSVLGPLLFSLYTKSLGSVISSHGLSYHCYVEDTQLLLSYPSSDTQVATLISAFLEDISAWMSATTTRSTSTRRSCSSYRERPARSKTFPSRLIMPRVQRSLA